MHTGMSRIYILHGSLMVNGYIETGTGGKKSNFWRKTESLIDRVFYAEFQKWAL